MVAKTGKLNFSAFESIIKRHILRTDIPVEGKLHRIAILRSVLLNCLEMPSMTPSGSPTAKTILLGYLDDIEEKLYNERNKRK